MLTLFIWLPECWLAGVGVLIIQKKNLHSLVILQWFAPWGLSTVVCCYCRVRPLQIFLTAQSLWDRRLLRLAHWPCSMSGPMGAQEAWESQFVKGTSVTHNTEHVQTLDYTRLVFVDFAEPAIQVWIRIRTCKGLWFATLKVNQSVVCCSYGSDLCDFMRQLCACLCSEKESLTWNDTSSWFPAWFTTEPPFWGDAFSHIRSRSFRNNNILCSTNKS